MINQHLRGAGVRRSRVVTFAAIRLRGPGFKPRPGQKFETRFLLHSHHSGGEGVSPVQGEAIRRCYIKLEYLFSPTIGNSTAESYPHHCTKSLEWSAAWTPHFYYGCLNPEGHDFYCSSMHHRWKSPTTILFLLLLHLPLPDLHSKLKCHLFKKSYPDSSDPLSFHSRPKRHLP